jgi:SAM-dependent methyltransferase
LLRSCETEILDGPSVPEAQAARAYRDLTRLHRYLGDTASIVSAVRSDPLPVRRVLDVGCGQGGVLCELRERLPVEVLGVDLNPLAVAGADVPILLADAVIDPLPKADLAFSMCLGHHLSETQLVKLIRNVGRSCRRFILMDLVRHPLPLALFRLFLAPFLGPIAVADGQTSIRRSYTPAEMTRIAAEALGGAGHFRHSVAPFYARQTLDIEYA